MKNSTFHFHFFLFYFLCFTFFAFLSIPFVVSASNYPTIAPGDSITLGEFVFDDNFVATTTDCWVGITNPLGTEMVASNKLMTANNDGWHYYDYTTASNAPSGTWPSIMKCGTVARGDLVIVDKSFIVDWSVVSTSTIKTVVDESLTVATSSLSAVINSNTNAVSNTASSSVVSQILSSITSIPANVWGYSSRTLSSFGSLVADTTSSVWSAVSRTLTGSGLDSGSLATLSDIQTATSSLASATTASTNAVNSNLDAQLLAASTSLASFITNNSNATVLAASTSLASYLSTYTDAASSSIASFVNANTNSTILAASTSLAAFINANTNSAILTASTSLATVINANTNTQILSASTTLAGDIAKKWTVTLSDFGETTVNTAYKAKLQVLNYATVPTDADSLPTVVVTDPAGTIQVPAGVMTKDSNGTYSYSYSIGGSAIGGVWETVVSVVVNGETLRVNDYWNLSSSPADVNIVEITDKVIPSITANVRIDNMGTSASDFYYVYCLVSSEDNLCGGNDDIDSASDTAYITAGSFINLSLTLDDVPSAGTYWFKVKARALAEPNWAASTEQFVAESGTVTPPPTGGDTGGGGGGGGGIAAILTTPTASTNSCSGADLNGDKKVNSVDFSILLAFWRKTPPFKNPCVDINKDNKVSSVDFSILLYEWGKK